MERIAQKEKQMKIYVDIFKRLGDFELDVSFETENEVFGILGKSGCGKSLTLRCIAGIETPDRGVIAIDGRVLFDSSRGIDIRPQKRRTGYLFQDNSLFPNMTVAQNIAVSPTGKKHCDEYIERFFLRGLENLYPHELSAGQKQRAALARLLASEPDMLMLDEPFSSLDKELRDKLEDRIAETIDDFEGSVIFVSHDIGEVYRLTDRIAVMHDGRIAECADKDKLFASPETTVAARLTGCSNISSVSFGDCGAAADDWGIVLGNVPEESCRYVGCRPRDLELCGENDTGAVECEVIRVTEDMLSYRVVLRPKKCGGASGSPTLIYETDKLSWPYGRGDRVFIRPDKNKLFYMVR